MENEREIALQAWCEARTGYRQQRLEPVSGDASFRRYFRCSDGLRNLIAVDAPPPQESLQPFMAIAAAYQAQGVCVPEVIAYDHEQGFMLLTDFGSTLLLAALTEANMSDYYQQALRDLVPIMQVQGTSEGPLPPYDESLLRRELALFHDWLVETHLQLKPTAEHTRIWQTFCAELVGNALAQPQVGVHRDYHARNIMVLAEQQLGYIDFQDAVLGPITYDAVSLLRDCYICWPTAQVNDLLRYFYQHLQEQGMLSAAIEWPQFKRWFDLMGLQRHTKAAGIFARLYHRDGKAGYLRDIPRTVQYLRDVAAEYPEFADYRGWLESDIIPALEAQ